MANYLPRLAMEPLAEPMEASLPPEDLVRAQCSSIQKFYSGTNILLTGGTGFMGKMLVEKLLRACPDVQTIYLIIRGKKGKDMHTRIDEMFDDPVFDRLKQECSKFRHKVVGISGDCAVTGLGLSLYDRKRLSDEVHVVFHVAATVRFDEQMRLAMAINVHATSEILKLCRQMMHLRAFVHVSTAFSNCQEKHIEERFYEYPITADNVDMMLSKLDDAEIQELTPKILGQWPNTYAFTKALAEAEVSSGSKGLPAGVFRPAIVISTAKEPIVGWIDNVYGPTGVAAGAYKGILRTLHCNQDMVADMVPVDMCVNALIASAWDVATNKAARGNDEIPIYNYVSSVEKPLKWGEYMAINLMYADQTPTNDMYWSVNFRTNRNKYINFIYVLMLHFLPAAFFDLLLIVMGKSPQMLKLYKKIHKFSGVLSHFSINHWQFSNDNVQTMWKRLDHNDKALFHFSMADMDWLSYFRNYLKGLRIYLFKDPLETLEMAKKKQYRFKIMHSVVSLISQFLIVYIPWLVLSTIVRSFF